MTYAPSSADSRSLKASSQNAKPALASSRLSSERLREPNSAVGPKNVLSLPTPGCWKPQEDLLILALVHSLGPKQWKKLAIDLNSRLPGTKRTGKECRERWMSVLDLSSRKDSWTDEEEEVFILAHKMFGNKWTRIAEYMPGRTDGYLKNHFYSKVRAIMSKLKCQDLGPEVKESLSARKNIAYYIKYMRDAINFIDVVSKNQPEVEEDDQEPKRMQDRYLVTRIQEMAITKHHLKSAIAQLRALRKENRAASKQSGMLDSFVLGKRTRPESTAGDLGEAEMFSPSKVRKMSECSSLFVTQKTVPSQASSKDTLGPIPSTEEDEFMPTYRLALSRVCPEEGGSDSEDYAVDESASHASSDSWNSTAVQNQLEGAQQRLIEKYSVDPSKYRKQFVALLKDVSVSQEMNRHNLIQNYLSHLKAGRLEEFHPKDVPFQLPQQPATASRVQREGPSWPMLEDSSCISPQLPPSASLIPTLQNSRDQRGFNASRGQEQFQAKDVDLVDLLRRPQPTAPPSCQAPAAAPFRKAASMVFDDFFRRMSRDGFEQSVPNVRNVPTLPVQTRTQPMGFGRAAPTLGLALSSPPPEEGLPEICSLLSRKWEERSLAKRDYSADVTPYPHNYELMGSSIKNQTLEVFWNLSSRLSDFRK